jgi:hypothetical protein
MHQPVLLKRAKGDAVIEQDIFITNGTVHTVVTSVKRTCRRGPMASLVQLAFGVQACGLKSRSDMQIAKVFGTTILSLFLIAPTIAQEKREEKQPEQKQPQAKPTPQRATQQEAKPAQPQHAAQQQAKPAQQQPQRATQPEAKPAQPQQQHAAQQTKPAQQQHTAQQQAKPVQQRQTAQQPQRSSREQPSGSHGRIPDDRFRASFGREHTFHVNRADFAAGSRRFQYGGYWFAMVEPWPVAWLYTDNVYVDFMNGGYFLCDPVHPGVYLSINIG